MRSTAAMAEPIVLSLSETAVPFGGLFIERERERERVFVVNLGEINHSPSGKQQKLAAYLHNKITLYGFA